MVAPLVVAAGVSALGGVISSIFGKKKTQTTTSRTNFQQLRDDAAAAGYNPLTALGLTGGAGNVTSTSTQPRLSAGEIIGNAMQSVGGSSWANQDPMERERASLENKLMRAELGRMTKTAQQTRAFPMAPTAAAFGTDGAMPVAKGIPLSNSGLLGSERGPGKKAVLGPAGWQLGSRVVPEEVKPLNTTYIGTTGGTAQIPAAGDFGEALWGALVDSYTITKEKKKQAEYLRDINPHKGTRNNSLYSTLNRHQYSSKKNRNYGPFGPSGF